VNVSKLFGRKWILITALVIVGALVCARLGIWQLDRLAQRRAFNSHVYAMQALPPLELPSQEQLTGMEYRAVQASGTYDFEHQVAIRNQFHGNQYGYHLLTPLHLSDAETVLVDRGWIPADGNSAPADWRKYDDSGTVIVNGVIRLEPTDSTIGGAVDPTLTPGQTQLDFWVYVNIKRIRQQMPYPILPIYIQLNPDPNRTNPPIPIQPELDLSEGPHQGYAIQWFSFSTILLVGYPLYVRKQENRQK
jgi:surfeit locus 1 family protein